MLTQSVSLPGSPPLPNAVLRAASRALRAAARARAAETTLLAIALASAGCSSKYSASALLVAESTMPRMCVLPSFVLVWPSNCGSGRRTEMTAASPSATSSPVRFSSFSLSRLLARA